MVISKRLVMDFDFYDFAWSGWTRDKLDEMFEKCARGGVRAMFWSVMWAGYAQYPSQILPLYDGRDRREGSLQAARVMRSFDSLATAVELGKKYRIAILPYFRLFDDCWFGLVDERIDRMEHGWWESRCGHFQLKGWPCYSMPEVREYKLSLVKEIASYGVDGFLFGLTRTHSFYLSPYRRPHFFGYNQPVAEEYLRRYGTDIRRYDFCNEHMVSGGPFDQKGLIFVDGVDYTGTAPFDLKKWHDLKGEGVTEFLRQARTLLGPGSHLAIEASPYACPPMADPNDPMPAKMFFYPAQLAREGIINEWVVSDNWRNLDFDKVLFPAYQEVLDAGAEINVWLNDIFSPTGGGTDRWAPIEEVEGYLKRFQASGVASATLHQADSPEHYPDPDGIWNLLADLFGEKPSGVLI